jgi:hypothetical protein
MEEEEHTPVLLEGEMPLIKPDEHPTQKDQEINNNERIYQANV